MKTLRKWMDRHMVIGILLLLAGNMILMTIAESITTWFVSELPAIFCILPGIVTALVILFIFGRFYKKEFLGCVRGGRPKEGIAPAGIMLIYYVFIMLQTLITGKLGAPTAASVGMAVMAGAVEESIFRGVLVSYMLKIRREQKDIVSVLIISAVLFGLAHSMNIFMGAAVGITVMQVLGTIGMGALFAAAYIRSGNIIISMVIHGLTDFLCFLDVSAVGEGGIMIEKVTVWSFADVALCAALFGLALYLVRPAKREEICVMWHSKWNKTVKQG